MTSDVDKAHCFNEYLSPVFTIEEVSAVAFLYRKLDVYNSPVLLDTVVTTTEVSDLLCFLNIIKACMCGPDFVCAWLLKEGAAKLALSLSVLFNKSL